MKMGESAKTTVCNNCNAKNAEFTLICEVCGSELGPSLTKSGPHADKVKDKLKRRYQKAYIAADSIVLSGGIVKGAGYLAGFAIFLGGAVGGIPVGIWITGASLFAILGYVVGSVLAAIGQTVMAALDTAVNTSPLLSDEDRVDAMRLRGSQ